MTTATQLLVLGVSDSVGRDLGTVEVESIADGLVIGEFTPGSDYSQVEAVFCAFADMVEAFSLHHIDRATADIENVGVTIRAHPARPPVAVHDVQIYSDGGFSCRLPRTR